MASLRPVRTITNKTANSANFIILFFYQRPKSAFSSCDRDASSISKCRNGRVAVVLLLQVRSKMRAWPVILFSDF
jgi:hypothetical protein